LSVACSTQWLWGDGMNRRMRLPERPPASNERGFRPRSAISGRGFQRKIHDRSGTIGGIAERVNRSFQARRAEVSGKATAFLGFIPIHGLRFEGSSRCVSPVKTGPRLYSCFLVWTTADILNRQSGDDDGVRCATTPLRASFLRHFEGLEQLTTVDAAYGQHLYLSKSDSM
jgi:hypothetical protein